MKMAEQSVEDYADEMLTWTEALINEVVDTPQTTDDEGVVVQIEPDGTLEDLPPVTNVNTSTFSKPSLPLFSSTTDIESLTVLLSELSTHFTSTYKAHANAAKFERLLDEKYGRFRPFIESHPQVEYVFKKLQRKYVRGEFSPFAQQRPMGLSSAVMMLFMLRQRVEMPLLILVGLFTIIGLQPWALVGLVCVGRYSVEKRRRKRLGGMTKRVKIVESYYAQDKEESENEEKERKYSILRKGVGSKFNPADLTLRDEKFDIICLGGGVDALYAAALLARSGKNVCVLCENEDASGCVSISNSNGQWGTDVPFDIHNHSTAYISKQQCLLAPALCTSTDVQGGIRFARIGSEADGYAHSILSIPGLGTNSSKYEDIIPVVLNAQGANEIVDFCYNVLGDGYPTIDEDGNDNGNSTSLSYLKACAQINAGAGDYYLSRLYPANSSAELAFKSPECEAYRSSTMRSASAFLNKCISLHPHVRSLMGAIGMMNENLSPERTCMAAHVSNLCAMTNVEGLNYPVGGPRALCHALTSVIEQCGGRVVTSVALQELLVDDSKLGKKEEGGSDKKLIPRCRGVRLENGMEVTTTPNGSVISFLGFIPTFMHLLLQNTRTPDGVPMGLPALSERRPLMKVLVGIKGTKEELNITGADWYRLPNASVPRDELDADGQVRFGAIGVDDGTDEGEGKSLIESLTEDHSEEESAASNDAGKRGKRNKSGPPLTTASKTPPRKKFTSGVSWMKVSFPSAKDPSWEERYGNLTTCVVTVEACDDFVKMFDTKPKMFSILKNTGGEIERFQDRVLKDLMDAFPQIQRKQFVMTCFYPATLIISH